jgi:glc operon protein GlcG
MKYKPYLILDDAQKIGAAAEKEARSNNWTVAISIVDDGGHLLWFQRLDAGAPALADIASAKATTAALGQRETKEYSDMVTEDNLLPLLRAPGLNGLLEGGLPIMVDGYCIGAVGVSGVESPQDAQIARAGIAAFIATLSS